jgi:hypothetical protein
MYLAYGMNALSKLLNDKDNNATERTSNIISLHIQSDLCTAEQVCEEIQGQKTKYTIE